MNKSDFNVLKKMKRYFIANMFISIITIILLVVYYILGFFYIEVKKHEILPIVETISLSSKFSLLFMILFLCICLLKLIIFIITIIKFLLLESWKRENISYKGVFFVSSICAWVCMFLIFTWFWKHLFIAFFILIIFCAFADIIITVFPIKNIKKELKNIIDKEKNVSESSKKDVSIY